MKLLKNKKGTNDKLYFMLIQLILLLLVITTLFIFVNNSINGTYFERIYHSRNLALIVDAIGSTSVIIKINKLISST